MEDEQGTTTNSTTATSSITSTPHSTHQHPLSVYSSAERRTVQVIQQALHRPSSSAAQYLQQLYAAQQQHIMLQTAALQQEHTSNTQIQSLAAIQQESPSGGRRSSSPTGNITQKSSMSQTSVNSSTSPTPAQLMSHSQVSRNTSISQQTMLLGSTSPTLTTSQAQMYLRAQMLIFTPAVTVAAVHSDIPPSSSSCQSIAAQVPNLTVRSQQLGALSSLQKSPPRNCTQSPPLAISHKPSVTSSRVMPANLSLEINRKIQSSTSDPQYTTVTHTSSMHQLIPTAAKGPHHQFVQQQQQQQQHQQQHPEQIQLMQQQQNQTTTVQNPPLDSAIERQCSSFQIHASSLTKSPTHPQSPHHSVVVSPPPTHSPSHSPSSITHPQSQPHCVPSSALSLQNSQKFAFNEVHPAQQLHFSSHSPPPPPPLAHIGAMQHPNMVSSGQQIVLPSQKQHSILQSTTSHISTLAPMSETSPAHLHTLPQQPMQAEAMQPEILPSTKVLLRSALISEEELPAAEALVQLPFHTFSSPQTVAVNLQVQPPVPIETPVVYRVDEVCAEEMPEVSTNEYVHILRTPTPPTLSPQCVYSGNGEELTLEDTLPDHVGVLKETPSGSASVIKSPSNSSCVSLPPPPILLPAAATTRSNYTLMPNSIPSTVNNPPQAIVKPQILTHVIEGFVIQEGLEPFPVNRSSLMVKRSDKARLLTEEQIMSITCMESELPDNLKHSEFSTDTDMEDTIAEDGLEEIETELLKCEFCGQTDYANKFLRSKRFCSMSCAKRYTGNCPKRIRLFKASKTSHWSRKSEKSLNRRAGRASGSEGAVREHFLRQLPSTYSPTDNALLVCHEDPIPTAMTTRLRRQSEREKELRGQRTRKIPEGVHLLLHAQMDPSLWTVEEVWAFIHSLPGCHDIADEFRTHEIDGQALLLLREDHLMSAMNIKLGPALKICSQINSLKE